jgi:hypothetical protein
MERGMLDNAKKEEIHRLLLILKNDSQHLHERLILREREYIQILSLKRTRSHFPAVFKSRYDSVAVEDLKQLSEEVIIALDNFYYRVENLHWYLNHTEDMPAMIEDKVSISLKEITSLYNTLTVYLNAELGVIEEE